MPSKFWCLCSTRFDEEIHSSAHRRGLSVCLSSLLSVVVVRMAVEVTACDVNPQATSDNRVRSIFFFRWWYSSRDRFFSVCSSDICTLGMKAIEMVERQARTSEKSVFIDRRNYWGCEMHLMRVLFLIPRNVAPCRNSRWFVGKRRTKEEMTLISVDE